MLIQSLDELPLVAAYLRRVGAKAVNFRRATVQRIEGKYPKAVGSIRFNGDGSMSLQGQVDAPSKAEADAIAEEYRAAEMPTQQLLAAVRSDLPPGVILDDRTCFVCRDFEGQVVMIQQRVELQHGGKAYIPWTYWSDGEWRKMEPEGPMPFYGLESARDSSSTLFIHEGAKPASKIRRMISGGEPADGFPWLEEMRWGCHIGWLGGVHALERSDWSRLAAMPWKRVVIIPDNDAAGKAVVPKISAHFRCPTFAVIFDENWPAAFDLADAWPARMFSPEGQYIGEPLPKMLQPATWATDEFQIIGDNGRPKTVHGIRQVFAEQWAWIEEQDVVVNLELPRHILSVPKFNGSVRPFSHVANTAGLLQKHYSGAISKLTYNPAKEGKVIKEAQGLLAVNLYEGSSIRPLQGDTGPWDDFLAYLFPVDLDREQVRRWIATLVAQPATRMLFGLLLMSEAQGTGKSTLGNILADLIGRHNASFPGEAMITGSEFNGWVANKRLIVVGEIYQGHSWKAYNKLKPYVSDDAIEVNVKHQATYSQPNWCHFVLCSNSPAALKLESSDRRWLVPKVTEVPWSKERFRLFHQWLRSGGLGYISHWAHSFEERGEGRFVEPGEIAPLTCRKSELIDSSIPERQRLIRDIGEALVDMGNADPPRRAIVTVSSVRKRLAEHLGLSIGDWRMENEQAIRKGLAAAGLRVRAGDQKIIVGGVKQAVALNFDPLPGEKWPELVRNHLISALQEVQDAF